MERGGRGSPGKPGRKPPRGEGSTRAAWRSTTGPAGAPERRRAARAADEGGALARTRRRERGLAPVAHGGARPRHAGLRCGRFHRRYRVWGGGRERTALHLGSPPRAAGEPNALRRFWVRGFSFCLLEGRRAGPLGGGGAGCIATEIHGDAWGCASARPMEHLPALVREPTPGPTASPRI